jgi:hypothetical protein
MDELRVLTDSAVVIDNDTDDTSESFANGN